MYQLFEIDLKKIRLDLWQYNRTKYVVVLTKLWKSQSIKHNSFIWAITSLVWFLSLKVYLCMLSV